jgi:outer membrane protein
MRQEVVLNVTLAYLQVLNNRDILQLAQARKEATMEQLKLLKSR